MTSALKATPGPWSVVDGWHVWTDHSPTGPDGKGYPVAECVGMRDWAIRRGLSSELLNADVLQANARLIAAAPELYAIGEKLLAIFDHPTASVTMLESDELRAAIAKASGDIPSGRSQ